MFLFFRVSKNVRYKRGGIRICRQNMFVSVPKDFVGETFSVSPISGIEKIYGCEGCVTTFCRIFLSRSIEKRRRGSLLCSTKFLVAKKFMEWRGERREGVSRFSVKTFVSQRRKNS